MAVRLGERTAKQVVGRSRSVGLILVGDSGTGKTRAGALSGVRPIVVVYERQGIQSILEWNPDAIVIPVFEDDADGTWTGEPFAELKKPKLRQVILKAVISAIKAGRPDPVNEGCWLVPSWDYDRKREVLLFDHDSAVSVDRFVLDSVSEWNRVEFDRLMGWNVAQDFDEGNIPLDRYDKVLRNTLSLLRQVRELPIPWVALFLTDERDKERSSKSYPLLIGKKSAPQIPQFGNAVGLLAKRQDAEGVAFGAYFCLPSDQAITKSCSGVEAFEPLPADPAQGNPSQWIERILACQPGEESEAAAVALRKGPDKPAQVEISLADEKPSSEPGDGEASEKPTMRRSMRRRK